MYLRTLGGLTLEGSDFARPMRLLLLAYLAIEGPTERTVMNDLFAAHVGDGTVTDPRAEADVRAKNLTTALRQIRKGASRDVIVRSKGVVEVALRCDAVEFRQAATEGHLERAADLFRGPFLHEAESIRYMRPDRWSPELFSWVRGTRLRFASQAVAVLTRLGRMKARLGDDAGAAKLAEQAFRAFEAALDDDDYTSDHSSFDFGDLQLLDALLALRPSPRSERYRELASMYVDLELPNDPAVALREHLEPVSIGLPDVLGEVVGRDRDAEQVADVLQTTRDRFVTIFGTGGVGKTTLALLVARRRQAEGYYPDGVRFVALEDIRFANLIPVRIAAAVDATLQIGDDPVEQLIAGLRGRRMLLVLDNYDQLVERADVVDLLAASCPELDVIVTSRERLGTVHEYVHPVKGLDVHPPDKTGTDGLRAEAVTWFVHAARLRKPDFAFDDAAQRSIASLCRYLEGHPLAIELAANLVDLMPLEDVEARVRIDTAVLDQAAGEGTGRTRSLHALWESSWDALDENERERLGSLAVFQGGFTWEGAQEVAGARVAELRRWVDRSLVHSADERRLRVHPALKAFLRTKLRGAAHEGEVVDRHRRYFLRTAEEQAGRLAGATARSALAFFEVEAPNLRSAWESTSDPEVLARFARALALPHLRLGDLDGRMALLERTATAAEAAGRSRLAAEAGAYIGDVHLQRGEIDEADVVLTRVLTRADEDVGDATRAEALSQLGGVHYLRREHDASIAHFERAREIYMSLGERAQVAAELGNVGAVHFQRAAYDDAIRTWKKALTGHRRSGDLALQALTLNNLGAAHQALGAFDAAAVCLEKADALLETLGDTAGLVSTWLNLGTIAFVQGAYLRSRNLNQRALDAYQRLNDALGTALVRTNLAMLDERQGALDDAHAALERTLAVQERFDERVHRVTTLYNLATVTLQLGNATRAAALAREALDLAGEAEHPVGTGYALTFLGDALEAMGDGAEADAAYQQASERFEAASEVVGSLTLEVRRAGRLLACDRATSAFDVAVAACEAARRYGLLPLAVDAARLASRAAHALDDDQAAGAAVEREQELEQRLYERATSDAFVAPDGGDATSS